MPKRKPGQLTAKEESFVEHLLADPKRNQTQAAKLAGYSEKNASIIASQNLNKLNVKQAINEKLEPIRDKLKLDAEWVFEQFRLIAQRCMTDEHFDQAGANRAVENIAKLNGLFAEKIQLDANVNNKHSVDMVRILEADTTSQDAFALLMERKRSERLIGANNGD